jgi:hypothetical protein
VARDYRRESPRDKTEFAESSSRLLRRRTKARAHPHTVKKVIVFPVPSRDGIEQILPGRELLNYSWPGRVWSVTSRLGTGKTITFYFIFILFFFLGGGDFFRTFYYSADPLDYSEKICHLIRVFYSTFGLGNPFLYLASETQ